MEGIHSSRSSCSLIVQLWLWEMQSQADRSRRGVGGMVGGWSLLGPE